MVVTEPEVAGVSDQSEFPEQSESEEASPVQHNSSGYASDGSGAGGSNNSSDVVQCQDFVQQQQQQQQQQQASCIQSDPGQSAFRPALPGGVAAQYPGLDGEFQYRQGGGGWGETGEMYGPPLGMMTQAGPHHITPHPGMHTPIARRPITGNMSGGVYPANPSYGGLGGRAAPPHNNHSQYRQPAAYSGASWGSPSWSGNGPPSGPPPMSMTPPPLSWNQANNRRPNFPQQNKPFGNIQYGGNQPQMMQHQMRSKNYPFPTKALNQGNAEIIPDQQCQ